MHRALLLLVPLCVACGSSVPDDLPDPPAAREKSSLTEKQKIERLLAAVRQSGLVFVRNGKDHDAAGAADHLQHKWSRAGDRIKTAEQFIEHIASRSSMSGRAYQVRHPDGTVEETGAWLRARLAELD